MRSSIIALVAAASLASAATLPKRANTWRGGFSMPSDAFPNFQVVTLEEAKEGKDREIQGLPPQGLAPNTTKVQDTADFDNFATTATTADSAACSANPAVHREWRDYPDTDRKAFLQAIQCLMDAPPSGNFPPAKSRYEDLVRLHQNYMPDVHNNAKFLLWHRYYMWTFEQVLRDECGFDRDMVWWDETLDAGRFAQSDMFTNAYFGSLPLPDANNNPLCITDGMFGGLTVNIGPGQATTPHCLARGVNEAYTAQCNSDFINYCNERTDYANYETCLEYGPHGYGHNGVGGVMADVWSSPSDPIFWMHHSFIDHSWRLWQDMDASRVATIDGVDHNGATITMDTILSMNGIRPDIPVSSIINTLGGVKIGGVRFCYRYSY